MDPGHISAIYHLGAALRTLARLDEALAAYDRALSLDAALPWAAYNRGLILSRQDRYAAAVADFTRTLELDPNYATPAEQSPNYAWAYYDRGYARLKQKQYKPAIADSPRPRRSPLDSLRCTTGARWPTFGSRKKEKAREDMRRAARLGSPAAAKWLAGRAAAAKSP